MLFKSNKHVFWQALLAALILFNIGIFLGYMLEATRVGKVSSLFSESEIDLFDVKTLSDLFELENLNCNITIKENINFGDRIFEDAKTIQEFEDAARITENIKLQHKKYDLLRTLFWINSIKIKEKCGNSFNTVVYLYQYNDPSLEEKAKQSVFSKFLMDLKNKRKDNVLLIPIATDNNVTSLNLLLSMHNITETPAILINEQVKITNLEKIEDIEKYLN